MNDEVDVMTILTVVMFFDPGSNWLRMSAPILSPSSLSLRRSRNRMISRVALLMMMMIIDSSIFKLCQSIKIESLTIRFVQAQFLDIQMIIYGLHLIGHYMKIGIMD